MEEYEKGRETSMCQLGNHERSCSCSLRTDMELFHEYVP